MGRSIVWATMLLAGTTQEGSPQVRELEAEAGPPSSIEYSMHNLADVHGPRLTGSPNERAAAAWAMRQMSAWGLTNGSRHPWHFGHDGWVNVRSEGFVVAPIRSQLHFAPIAWTPGTGGRLVGDVVLLTLPEDGSRAALERHLEAFRGAVRGRIVLVGRAGQPPVSDGFEARLSAETLRKILDPSGPPPARPMADGDLTSAGRNVLIDAFLKRNGALMRVDDAFEADGRLRAANRGGYDVSEVLPGVTMTHQDFGRIVRLLSVFKPVRLEFTIVNRSFPEGRTSSNVTADIAGSDRRDEIVMIGAHLDSWHLATGATDNAIGCAIIMEAARILLAGHAKPRRTIRVALWTGEEQGLLGSQAYVARNFGTAEKPGPLFEKLSAYINLDSGTGRIRAANVFGPPQAASFVQRLLQPLSSDGVAGVVSHGIRRLRGTDATTFSRAGLPAIGLVQDPIDYGNLTWHSNLDSSDRIRLEDARQAASVIAKLALDLANSEEPVPRFSKTEMPPAEGPPPALRPLPAAPESGGKTTPWKKTLAARQAR